MSTCSELPLRCKAGPHVVTDSVCVLLNVVVDHTLILICQNDGWPSDFPG